jgi:hypothetical protein
LPKVEILGSEIFSTILWERDFMGKQWKGISGFLGTSRINSWTGITYMDQDHQIYLKGPHARDFIVRFSLFFGISQ